jgi:hypothetical protein
LFGNSSFLTGQAFGSVLSGFGSQANTLGLEYSSNKFSKASAKLGFVSVDPSRRFAQDSFSSIVEGRYQFNEGAGLTLQFGQIEEKGGLFGSAAGGTFGVKRATTYALNLSGNMKLNEKLSVIANYGVGKTTVASAQNSLLKGFTNLDSNWYSVGLVANNLFRPQEQIGVAISQPLKITSGSVNYSIPTGRAFNGDIVFDSERISLSETGATEQNIEAYYRTMLSDKLEFGSFVSFRQNPNHVSDHGDELILMATLRFNQ